MIVFSLGSAHYWSVVYVVDDSGITYRSLGEFVYLSWDEITDLEDADRVRRKRGKNLGVGIAVGARLPVPMPGVEQDLGVVAFGPLDQLPAGSDVSDT